MRGNSKRKSPEALDSARGGVIILVPRLEARALRRWFSPRGILAAEPLEVGQEGLPSDEQPFRARGTLKTVFGESGARECDASAFKMQLQLQ